MDRGVLLLARLHGSSEKGSEKREVHLKGNAELAVLLMASETSAPACSWCAERPQGRLASVFPQAARGTAEV